jgi:serine/threonine-protein kinase
VITALTHYNYLHRLHPNAILHAKVIVTLALWALASLTFQGLLRGGWGPRWVRTAWLGTDVLLLTTAILELDRATNSVLVVGYPLLIAASGLWFQVRLVWITTLLSEAAYAALMLWTHARGGGDEHPWSNIFMAALAVTGFVVAQQVRRLWAISFYYEQRPIT